jgi:ABC-2 type transport system permease protein
MEVTEQPRYGLGPVNWIGLWTLYKREVRRFLKVAAQTVTGPVVTTLLFLAVFSVALGRRAPPVEGVTYIQFLAPGLIMMAMAQNAFANTSSSLLIAKVQGNISDFLMAPLSAGELTTGLILGGVTRGLLVGLVVSVAMWPFVRFALAHPGFALFHATAATLLLALLGVFGGLWSQKMDHLAAVTNFVVTPLTFLSGTFYSVADLSPAFRAAAHLNPLLLHDRRIPLRHHRPRGRVAHRRSAGDERGECCARRRLPPDDRDRMAAQGVKGTT